MYNYLNFDRQDLHKFKLNCLNIYIETAHQLYIRFPFKSDHQNALAYTYINVKGPAYFKPNRPISVISLVTVFLPTMFYIKVQDDSNDYYQFWRRVEKIFNNYASL